MKLILRCVHFSSSFYKVEEYFVEFLKVDDDTTSLELFEVLKDMKIDIAMTQVSGLISYFSMYRETGFGDAMMKLVLHRFLFKNALFVEKKQFDETSDNETILSLE